jgi:hypothetical protein
MSTSYDSGNIKCVRTINLELKLLAQAITENEPANLTIHHHYHHNHHHLQVCR